MNTQDDHRTASLVLAGDTMLGRGVNQVVAQRGPRWPLEALHPITREADLFLVNLENAFCSRHLHWPGAPKAFYFVAPPEAVDVLSLAGVDGVSLANNHVLDADHPGLSETLQLLDARGIAHAGAGENLDEALRPARFEVNGIQIGLISACDHQEDFQAGASVAGIHYLDWEREDTLQRLAREVSACRRDCDHVIVALHWQTNWAPIIQPQYRSLAHHLVDSGATIIWGHSPHHFQGVEWRDGALILYSTGDFLDDYAVDPGFRNDRQLLFFLTLTAEGVRDVKAFPLDLEFGHTLPASGASRDWIARRFLQMCRDTGSRVVEEEEWLRVIPAQESNNTLSY